jgi:hypothetical protein
MLAEVDLFADLAKRQETLFIFAEGDKSLSWMIGAPIKFLLHFI